MARRKPRAASPLQIDLANRIVGMIKDGTFKPEQHLTEPGLAEQFGVSRSPVRTALRLLEARGYVEVRERLGVFVTKRAPNLPMPALVGRHLTEEDLYRAIITDRANHEVEDTISEAELLARYSASRGQLLKTLMRMAGDGLIERRKGNGWSFLPMLDSSGAKQDSYRFRMILECAGLREPGFRADPVELAKLRAQHERFLASRPTAESVPADFFEMNAHFHEWLARSSGNRFIHAAVRQQNQLRRFEEYATYARRAIHPIESCREHLQIIDAIKSGDRDLAAALLYSHLFRASKS